MAAVFDPDENDPPWPDEFDVCHHGVGFDEECEDCEIEIQLELEDDVYDDEYDGVAGGY